MKRNGQVVSRSAVRTGRLLAKWASSGMDWEEGDQKTAMMAAGRIILTGGAAVADRLGRKFLEAHVRRLTARSFSLRSPAREAYM